MAHLREQCERWSAKYFTLESMDATSVKAVAQRQLKLEKQREILQRKRQQKHAYEVQSLQAKSFNNSVDLGLISPRWTAKTPSRDSQTSVSENFGKFCAGLLFLLPNLCPLFI